MKVFKRLHNITIDEGERYQKITDVGEEDFVILSHSIWRWGVQFSSLQSVPSSGSQVPTKIEVWGCWHWSNPGPSQNLGQVLYLWAKDALREKWWWYYLDNWKSLWLRCIGRQRKSMMHCIASSYGFGAVQWIEGVNDAWRDPMVLGELSDRMNS
jgi:hypothetical protein